LTEASRIFVVKREHPILQASAEKLLAAMHGFGPATLLWVDQGGDDVEQVGAHLFHARIPRFADSNAITTTTPADDWLRVCRKVAALHPAPAAGAATPYTKPRID